MPELFQNINKKKHRLLLVCNKIDALPSEFEVDRMQQWVKKQVQKYLDDEIVFTICLTSAKKATGIEKVMTMLEKIKKSFDPKAYLPKVYVVGCTNSGKSSFVNAMIYKGNKYKEPGKVHYREKYSILTESGMPGTTLDLVSVDEIKLGFKMLDTPGIPNLT